MIDASARKFKVTLYIGSSGSPWDVTELVSPEGISITRQPLTMEGPPIVEGQLTLRGSGSESLNPRENLGRFLPSNLVHIQVADSTGTLKDLPFGARLRIHEFDYDDGRGRPGEPPKLPQITLIVTDVLSQAREAEPPQDAEDMEVGTDTPIQSVVEAFLDAKQLTLVTGSGDPAPTATTKAPITYTGQDSVIEMAHKYLWCAPESINQSYYLWADNDEQVRIGVFSWQPTIAIFEVLPRDLILYKDILEEKEKMPGRVRGLGVGKKAEPRAGTSPRCIHQYDDQGALYCTTCTWTTVGNQGFSEHREVYMRLDRMFPEDYDYPAFYAMSLSERTITAHNFQNGRKNFILESTWMPSGKIDRGDSENPSLMLRLARNSRTDHFYTPDGRLDRKVALRRACRGLVSDAGEGSNPFEFITEGTECESWRNLYGDKFSRFNTSTDSQNRRDSSSTDNAEALPPASEMQPEAFEIKDVAIEYEAIVGYPGIPAGTIKRTKTLDLGEFVLNQAFCQRLAEQEAKRILGGWLAKDIAFAVPDSLLHNGWLPGLAIFVARGDDTSDVYLCSGEVITLDLRQCVVGVTGLWMGTRSTGSLIPSGSTTRKGVTPPGDDLGEDGDYYANQLTGEIYYREGGSYSVVETVSPPTNPTVIIAPHLAQESGDLILQENSSKVKL